MAIDLAHINARSDAAQWRSAWRARERWYSRWERDFRAVLGAADRLAQTNLPDALKAAGAVSKDAGDMEDFTAEHRRELAEAVAQRLSAGIAQGLSAGRAGALATYLGLSLDTSEDAGQYTLDALGLNKTFAWASQRDFVRDALAVRGSKIIQNLYGEHLARLAQIVVDATNPREPKTVDELTREIITEWSQLTQSEARRIARTEAGIVWERTNWYAMRANGIGSVRWVVAHGPAIGVRVGPVCPLCLAKAAGSPYKMDELDEIPPAHPNCRCTLIPVVDARWLPPAEPWTGAERPLPTRGLSDPRGTDVPTNVPVMKAGRLWGREGLVRVDAPARGWTAPGLGWLGGGER